MGLCVSQKLPCCCGFGCCPSDGPDLPRIQVLGSLSCIRVLKCLLEQEPLEVSVECAQGGPSGCCCIVAVVGYSPVWGGLWRPQCSLPHVAGVNIIPALPLTSPLHWQQVAVSHMSNGLSNCAGGLLQQEEHFPAWRLICLQPSFPPPPGSVTPFWSRWHFCLLLLITLPERSPLKIPSRVESPAPGPSIPPCSVPLVGAPRGPSSYPHTHT